MKRPLLPCQVTNTIINSTSANEEGKNILEHLDLYRGVTYILWFLFSQLYDRLSKILNPSYDSFTITLRHGLTKPYLILKPACAGLFAPLYEMSLVETH